MGPAEGFGVLLQELCQEENSFIFLSWESFGGKQRYTLSGERVLSQEPQNPLPGESFEAKLDQEQGFSLSGEWHKGRPAPEFFAQLMGLCPRGELVLQRREYQEKDGDWMRKGGYTLMKSHLPSSQKEVLALIKDEEAQLMRKLDR
jgi:hypothetical protein